MNFSLISDKSELKKTLFSITHGLYILTTADKGRLNGQCLDALMQVTSDPPRIAISIRKTSLTYEMINATNVFGINVLSKNDASCLEKVKHFGLQSGRNVDKFASIPYELTENGIPMIPDTKAFFECKVVCQMTCDLQTHTLFIADVTAAGMNPEGEPLTYNEYRKGKSNDK